MLRLFIENREIELTENVQVAITKQFEDLSNPTNIINDWSKTVSIPFTENNNRIFGYIFRPDRKIVSGSNSNVGLYFNPLMKMNFRLEWDSSIVMVGYAKMTEITETDNGGFYSITLFGELGKVFQDIQKITFDTTTDDTDYLIDGNQYVAEYINRSLVYNSWNSEGQTTAALKKIGETGYSVTDIIGFAPNNSFSEGFDYTTFQASSDETNTFIDFFGDSFTQDTGISPETVIPNGLLPREVGEYRSYLQLPFVYWNKLFQIFQEKAQEITGYEFDLDADWFNSSNPYWYNLVYMLKPFSTKKEQGATNYYTLSSQDIMWSGSGWTTKHIAQTMSYYSDENIKLANAFNVFPVRFTTSKDYSLLSNFSLGLNLSVPAKIVSSVIYPTYLSNDNALKIEVELYDGSDVLKDSQKLLVCNSNYTGSKAGYDEIVICDSSQYTTGYDVFRINPILHFNVMEYNFSDSVTFKITAQWVNNNAPFKSNNADYTPNTTLRSNAQTLQIQIDTKSKSNSYFTLNDLWNNDFNLFGEILKYCKMYRISVSVDEFRKKIIFKPINKYFESYTVSNWTNKIDKSKNFVVTPITFENKYILFNYKDNGTKMGDEYNKKHGVNYGDYRLVTDYNFNSETKKLFNDDIECSITNTDNVLSFLNLGQHKILYSFPDEIYVYNKDKDNKQVSLFGCFFFHNGTANFSTDSSLNLVIPKISDDSNFMSRNTTYFYTFLQMDYVVSNKYPKLDIVRGNNLCVFNIPKENYTYLNNYSDKNSIYVNFWDKYLNERYNIQNKKITCYVNLKPTDYNNFKWNKFVLIDNQLCIVNKIYDYDVSSNESTKVDLITIQDISGYTTNNFT